MFLDVLEKYDWNKIKQDIYSKTEKDVLLALNKPKRDLEDFKTLVSPAAFPYLEQMAKLSNKLTQKRFGKIIQLF
ncbi:MAG: 2-iminoacetate synthase ThiH, partial [Ignavibacteria bacterium]|nr:2-iminoacetate synthase ThiH [Ignavibacteria bacterium]